MRLRITTPPGDNFMKGWAASVFLNDIDVSRHVSKVVLTVAADGPITAEVTFHLTGVDVDVPAAISPPLATL